MKMKGKLKKHVESTIDWCGGYARFGAMAMITGVGVVGVFMATFNADPVVTIASLIFIPILAVVAGKMVS